VDDMEMNLYVSKGLLSLYGLQIDTALSGREAIEKVKANAYDLVFMDHMMPVMDGVEATREIRKWEDEEFKRENSELSEVEFSEGKRLPIVALTANVASVGEDFFLANGFNGFLAKPVDNEKLEAILKQFRLLM